MADVLLRLYVNVVPQFPVSSLFSSSPRFSNLRCRQGSSVAVACRPKRPSRLKVHAAVAENDGPKWWEKNAGPNMIDVHSTQEFLNALSQAGERLVIVEFYGTWCGSCRAMFPKLCRTAQENPDIMFLKVNFDENKPMCKRLNVRVLPYFHFYRGAAGRLDAFSCSLAKKALCKNGLRGSLIENLRGEMYLFYRGADGTVLPSVTFVPLVLFQKIKEAISTHNTARCSIGPPLGVDDLNLLDSLTPQEKQAEATS